MTDPEPVAEPAAAEPAPPGPFAIIKTGGKQYRVAAGDTLTIEKLVGEPASVVTFDQVLALGGPAGMTLGAPTVPGATVEATLVEHTRGDKILMLKKRRRKNSRRKKGHRQDLTVVRIERIGAAAA